MIPAKDATTLSSLFHLNSEPWKNAEAYQQTNGYRVDYLSVGDPGAAVSLPRPGESPLARLIRERYSCRKFQPKPMPLEAVSTLLWAANGLTHETRLNGGELCISRSIPSAGGLYPLEVFALAQRIEGLADGLYHYAVWNHAMEPVRAGASFREFESAVLMLPFVEQANLLLFLAAIFGRTQKKYGPRGYRYVLLEAGHAAQNICLAAGEGGLGSLCIGGYLDGELNAMLGLEEGKRGVVYVVGVGYPE